jgi:cytidylate kinase
VNEARSGARVVAIDGPAGAGKSTVARAVADRLGVTVLDTGAMYRAVTLACLHAGIDLNDAEACTKIGAACTIVLGDDRTVTLDGVDVTRAIRTPEVTQAVSTVSAHPSVRRIMVAHQRAWAERHPVTVVEGRDIGTVVFPDAAVKVFLVASVEERARRRLLDEEEQGRSPSLAELRADITRRDGLDSGREASPLRPADDAVRIDTTGRTIDDVVDEIVSRFETSS